MEIVFNLGTDSYLGTPKSLDKIMMIKMSLHIFMEKNIFHSIDLVSIEMHELSKRNNIQHPNHNIINMIE